MANGSLYKKEKSEQIKRSNKAKRMVLLILLASFAVFLVIGALSVAKEGVGAFLHTLLSINPFYYGISLLLLFLGNLVGFPKWQRFIENLKIKIPKKKNLMIYLSMFSMDITPGRWGRAVAGYTLNRVTHTPFAKTFPAIAADIFTDFLGFIVVVFVTSFLVGKFTAITVFIGLLLMVPFLFIFYKKPFKYIKGKWKRFTFLKRFFREGESYFASSKRISLGSYLYAMLFTIPSMVISGLSLFFVILAFGIHLPISYLPTILFIYSSALLFGIVSGIPAALGVTDAILIGYLSAFLPGMGLNFGVASAITIFFRLGSIWFVAATGFAFLFYTTRYWK